MTMPFQLATRYEPLEKPQFGRFIFALHNLSDSPISNFSLCFSTITRINSGATMNNASFLRRFGNYHEFAPPPGFVLLPQQVWTFAAQGLTHQPKHRLDGPKSAYLLWPDRLETVTAQDLQSSTNAPLPLREIPEGRIELPISIMPWPQNVAIDIWCERAPALVPDSKTTRQDLVAIAKISALSERLFPDQPLPFAAGDAAMTLSLEHSDDLAEAQYRIGFTPSAVCLTYASALGRDYGLTTLAHISTAAAANPGVFRFPAQGIIEDYPRHTWRGAHLDVVRHFWPVPDVMRFLDILAWLKMNIFQWHLTDDEGWRIEIVGLPDLTNIGAWRGANLPILPQHGSGAYRYGGYYSRLQIRQIVQHASALNIEIVPEIDVPGHSSAAMAAMPSLKDPEETPDSYHAIQGYPNNALNPAKPETYAFLETVFRQVADLFPGRFIHIGADEVDASAWHASPLAAKLKREKGLTSAGELQSHFLQRVQNLVRSFGKELAGWDEVSHGGGIDPLGTVLVAWQKPEVIARLAKSGYGVVASPGQAYYLDMAQADGWNEPGGSWAGTVTPEASYEYEAASDLPPDLSGQLIGVQACIWGEHLVNVALFNHMVFPRLAAVAEAGWTPRRNKDWLRFAFLSRGLPQLLPVAEK